MPAKYSRTNFQAVVTPPEGDPRGTDPYLSLLDGHYARFTESLKLQTIHTVTDSDEMRLEAISYRYYNNLNLWWAIGAYNGIINPFREVVAGKQLKIPTLASVEDYVKSVTSLVKPRVVVLP